MSQRSATKVVEVKSGKSPELEMFVGFCGPRKTEESHRGSLRRGVQAHSQIRKCTQAGGGEMNKSKDEVGSKEGV
jgi:hypothetical protein